MSITTLPTRTDPSLGAADQGTSGGEPNQARVAVTVDRLADAVVALAGDVGLTDGTTSGSLNQRRRFINVITEATTARTLTDSDTDSIIMCTHASGCTVTVPNALSIGFNCIVVQKGAAAVSLTGSGVTLNKPAANTAATSALDTEVSVIKYADAQAQLGGSLA